MLNEIKEALKKDGLPVFYGRVPENEEIETWDYYVFDRSRLEKSGNINYKQYFRVHIINEDFIPEGKEIKIIDLIKGIPGMRLADTPVKYDYMLKGNTDMVVEMATITFVHEIKRCV